MTDEPLTARLRRHAHDLVNGGTNASELRDDLEMAAEHLDAAAEIIKIKTSRLERLLTELRHPPDAKIG